ncbi:hypothetical protein [Eisenbergiella sp.]
MQLLALYKKDKKKYYSILKKIILSIAAFIIVFGIGLNISKTKLTYLEYTTLNSTSDSYVEIDSLDDEIRQEFVMPYDILKGISVLTGTFERENNSIWHVMICEKKSGNIVVEDTFNASFMEDNQYHFYDFGRNFKVNKGEKYELIIKPTKVNNTTSLKFYYSLNSQIEDSVMTINSTNAAGDLCIAVYGGDVDFWWTGFYLFVLSYIIVLVSRGIIVVKHKNSLSKDKIFVSLLLSVIVFLLMFTFAVSNSFTDELDNMRGGMIIAKGGVLYRDYITQHTPVTYYLCSLFALMGAGSVQQFRLSYYIVEAVIWGFLYFRHSENIGKKRMLLLPIAESIFISSMMPQGYQVLSDGIQGLCMVMLLLEFIEYYKDKGLGWIRCIIVSCCIWGSFGAAFISSYALFWIVLAVFILEIKYLKNVKKNMNEIFGRYYKLLVSVVTPLILAIIYFKINHSLRIAFEQFYKFNREVYSQYMGGLGENLVQPIIDALRNYFMVIANKFNEIIVASASNISILQLIIILAATVMILITIAKQKYMLALLFFMTMCCSATRGYGFHGLAAWYIAILVIVILPEYTKVYNRKVVYSIGGVVSVFLVSIYVDLVADNLLYKQNSISELDKAVISITDDGEGIFMDAMSNDSLYLCYKNRYPVNRAVYILPWYMDWYEQDAIEDLLSRMPRVAVFKVNMEPSGNGYYANALLKTLSDKYMRFSDNPEDEWMYSVWIRKQ